MMYIVRRVLTYTYASKQIADADRRMWQHSHDRNPTTLQFGASKRMTSHITFEGDAQDVIMNIRKDRTYAMSEEYWEALLADVPNESDEFVPTPFGMSVQQFAEQASRDHLDRIERYDD